MLTVKEIGRALPIASAIIGSCLTVSSPSLAQVPGNLMRSSPMPQAPSVTQLSDIQPTDWAYSALQSLVERYGCIAGYADGTFRGNRPLSRFEFAAGLNACLERIDELIAAATSEFVSREDLGTLLRLQEELAPELSIMRGRLDALETITTELEANQFSTTTKLFGFTSFRLNSRFGDKEPVPSGQRPTEDLDEIATFEASFQSLTLDTSFTGRDLLRTEVSGSDDISLGVLFYRIPLGFAGQAYFAATGLGSNVVFPVLNPVSSFSRFGARNPIFRLSGGGGAAIYYQFNDLIGAGVSYLSSSSILSNPEPGNGLFNGGFGALAQVTLTPGNRLGIAFTYARYFAPDGVNVTAGTGSTHARSPFGEDTATSANAFGIQTSYRISDSWSVGAWVGYTRAIAESSPRSNGIDASRGADAEIWNWAVTMAFPDILKLGSQLNLIVGMPPKISNTDAEERRDFDSSFLIELSYNYPLTDLIFLNSGFFVTINPENNSDNSSIWTGRVQVDFSF